MRIRTQFIVAMLLFGVVLVAISASAILTSQQVEKVGDQDRIAHNIAQGASELSYLANDYVMYREDQQLDRWQTRFARFSADVARLQAARPEQEELIGNIQANAQRLKDVFDSVVSAVGRSSADQGGTAAMEMLQTSWSRMAVQSQGLISDASRLSELLSEQVDRLQRTNAVVVIVLIGVFVAYFLVNYWLIQRRMLESIARLQAATAVIGSGNLDFRIEARRKDEIGDLSRGFNWMAAQLKSATEEVQVERQRLYNVLETLPAMICLLTPDHHVAFANRGFREKFGESHGRHCYEYCFGCTEPCDFCQSYRVLETGEPHHWEVTTPGGASVIDVHDFPFADVDGSPMILEMDIDITEQRAAESALIQAERLTIAGKMATSLAHEINNPLQAVVGCLGLAQVALESGKDLTNYLRVAHQEVRRAAQIVGQLRSLGRPVHDGRKEPTDINSLLNDLLLLNEKHLQTHNVEVIWEPDTRLPLLALVPDSMRQVFLNLVINATDAMPQGGQLRLSTATTTSPAGVRVVVADTGTGISPDVLPHIFDAFYSTKDEGLGVGLFVSRGIVQQHGGRIEVESLPSSAIGGLPATGTTFTIWLPARDAALPPSPLPPSAPRR
jgi:signal transduction histidine kinase/HAMP domain-containing protein